MYVYIIVHVWASRDYHFSLVLSTDLNLVLIIYYNFHSRERVASRSNTMYLLGSSSVQWSGGLHYLIDWVPDLSSHDADSPSPRDTGCVRVASQPFAASTGGCVFFSGVGLRRTELMIHRLKLPGDNPRKCCVGQARGRPNRTTPGCTYYSATFIWQSLALSWTAAAAASDAKLAVFFFFSVYFPYSQLQL